MLFSLHKNLFTAKVNIFLSSKTLFFIHVPIKNGKVANYQIKTMVKLSVKKKTLEKKYIRTELSHQKNLCE